MSVKKESSGRRSIEIEFEVPGTPEEVWKAIATGPGISSVRRVASRQRPAFTSWTISSVRPARSAAGTGCVNPAVLTSTCTAFTWLATSCAACARLAESVIDAFTAK